MLREAFRKRQIDAIVFQCDFVERGIYDNAHSFDRSDAQERTRCQCIVERSMTVVIVTLLVAPVRLFSEDC
jgi:hypothetical protein